MGDVLLNYRWQVSLDTGSRPAFAPRISVILPSSAERRALGASGTGLEVNLPVSKELGAVIVHANAGVTWFSESSSPFLAGRVIWGLRPLFHPMLEVTASWSDVDGDAKEATLTVLPGFRAGWNVGEQQVVLGMGIPIERGAARDYGLLVYFSYELPFRKN
jgi:hypothetical protein